MNGFISTLEANLQAETLPKIDTTEYKTKLELFKRTVEGNIRKIADKIKEPSSVVVLDDVKTVRDEINAIIDGVNAIIDENNTIIASKGDKQKECIKKTKELIEFTLAADIKAYNDSFTTLDKEYHDFQDTYKKNHDRSVELDRELTALNKDGVGTRATIDAVNKTLRDAGLQGFRLYPKDGEEHVYEVRRDGSDKPAKNLSEGERNFIAFLYFYHVVRGSYEETGKKRRKIVVIDDPIPVHEYDDDLVKSNAVGFRQRQSNVEKYISFFNSINGRKQGGPDYAYERCALLIVDFNNPQPHLFRNSDELKRAGYISADFGIEYENLNFQNFVTDILSVYSERYNLRNIMR